MDKNEIRINVKTSRETLEMKQKEMKDKAIFDKLVNFNLYKSSNRIFIYISFDKEVNTKDIIKHALNQGKKVYVPKVISKGIMKALQIKSLEDLEKNKMGILEPNINSTEISKEDIDLVIVPGIAFDIQGNRIGYGGGYYDRYLKDIENINNKVALAYDFQIVDKIDSKEHDIKVNYIISDKEFKNSEFITCK